VKSRWYTQANVYSGLLLVVLFTLAPFYWMCVSSIRPEATIFSSRLNLLPKPFTSVNYSLLFIKTEFLRWFFNSCFVSLTSTALALFFSSLAGFAFAKYTFYGKNVLFTLVLLTLSIPQFVTIIPVFQAMIALGFIDTYWALILPYSINPVAIFFMRQYINGIPSELLDYARIDGCSEFQIYWRIILPVIKPAIGATGIIIFLGSWNQYFWPLIMTRSQEMMVVPTGLASLKSEVLVEWGMLMAGSVMSTLPILVLFLICQKQFVSGLMAGSIKG